MSGPMFSAHQTKEMNKQPDIYIGDHDSHPLRDDPYPKDRHIGAQYARGHCRRHMTIIGPGTGLGLQDKNPTRNTSKKKEHERRGNAHVPRWVMSLQLRLSSQGG